MSVISPAQILLLPYAATSMGFDAVALAAVINGGLAIIIGLLVVLFCRRLPLFNKFNKNRLASRTNHRQHSNFAVEDIPSNASYLDTAVDSQNLVTNPFIRWFQIRIIFTWGLILTLIWPWSQRRDRQRTAKNLGSDFAIYFFFSQLMIYAFALITIISLAVLLPVHLSTTDRSFLATNPSNIINNSTNVTAAPTLPPGQKFFTCFGVSGNDPTVCGGNGNCVGDDFCQCEKGYLGTLCESYTCYGYGNSDSNVCSANGQCQSPDQCQCNAGFTGDQCNIPICQGKSGAAACSKNGKCIAPEQCVCDQGYVGADCSQWTCYNVTNTQANVCSGQGKCGAPDTCLCAGGYVGNNCQYTTCFTLWQIDAKVCSGNGQCSGIDQCTCNAGYGGNNCILPQCNNVNADQTGACTNNNQCSLTPGNCTCTTGTFDNQGNCQGPTCFGNAQTPCTGHGLCNGVDTCLCQGGYYGSSCDGHFCYGQTNVDTGVCYGRGTCTGYNKCNCNVGYSGYTCQDVLCFGVSSANANQACNGNGKCGSPDKCTCTTGWAGKDCAYPVCNNVDATQTGIVCNGQGTCSAPNKCVCGNGYVGNNCQIPVCFGRNATDTGVCSGSGKCSAANTCLCANGFSGTQCEIQPTTTTTTQAPTLAPTPTPAVPQIRQAVLLNANKINVLTPDNSIAEYTSSRVAGDWVNSWANIIIAIAILFVIIGLLIMVFGCMGIWMTSRGNQPMEAEFIASPYVLEIRNVDKGITDNEAFHTLILNLNNNDDSGIVKTSLILDLAKPTRLMRKLEKVSIKLDHFEYLNERKQVQPKTTIWCTRDTNGKLKFKSTVDAISYYRRKKQTLEMLIKEWDRMYTNADKQKSFVQLPIRVDTTSTSSDTDTASSVGLEVVVENGNGAFVEIINMDDYIHGSGIGFVIFKSVEAKQEFLQRFKQNKTHMKAKRITYESEDINWEAFYDAKRLSKSDMQRKRSSYSCWSAVATLVIVAILVGWVVPITVASAYQSMVDLAPLQNASDAARGVAGAFLLQYIPTFLLFITCVVGVRIISAWTNWERRKTFSASSRVSTVRSYLFLITSMLIVPLIVLAVSDALFIGPITNSLISTPVSLQQLFIPSTAIFFMTLLLHWTLLKNVMDAILASQIVRSIFNSVRFMSPREKLDAHRVNDMKLDREYAHMLAVTGVALCLSVTSPLILPIGLGYLLVKYFVDRFNAQHAQYHGRFVVNRAQEGADYMSQKKTIQMILALVMVNVIIFFGFLSFYFGFKTMLSPYYIPHMIIAIALAALGIISLGLAILIVKFRVNIDHNVATKNHFEPTTLLFEHLYEQPRLDEHGRENRKQYLLEQQMLRQKKMQSMRIIDVEYDHRSLAGLSPSDVKINIPTTDKQVSHS
jgi:hypothetical protein